MLLPPANQFVRDKQIQCKDVRMSIQTFDVALDAPCGQGQTAKLDIPVIDRATYSTLCHSSMLAMTCGGWMLCGGGRMRGCNDVTCVAKTMSHAFHGYYDVACRATTIEFIHKTNRFCRQKWS